MHNHTCNIIHPNHKAKTNISAPCEHTAGFIHPNHEAKTNISAPCEHTAGFITADSQIIKLLVCVPKTQQM